MFWALILCIFNPVADSDHCYLTHGMFKCCQFPNPFLYVYLPHSMPGRVMYCTLLILLFVVSFFRNHSSTFFSLSWHWHFWRVKVSCLWWTLHEDTHLSQLTVKMCPKFASYSSRPILCIQILVCFYAGQATRSSAPNENTESHVYMQYKRKTVTQVMPFSS